MGSSFGWIWILHIILIIITLYSLIKGGKTKNLSKLIWIIAVIILPLLGPIVYWIWEKQIFKS